MSYKKNEKNIVTKLLLLIITKKKPWRKKFLYARRLVPLLQPLPCTKRKNIQVVERQERREGKNYLSDIFFPSLKLRPRPK